jgi:hypothetical protein
MRAGHSRNTVIYIAVIAIATLSHFSLLAQDSTEEPRAWMHKARIGAYSLTPDNADEIVRKARSSWVYGIEVDNDVPGRYETLLNPTTKLHAIQSVSKSAHQAGNRAYVYIAGLECISAAGDGQHTLAKDHPDWLQRDLSGKPAVFTAGAAFWIKPGEEDAWVSPYAPAWRALYMERIRQIAATGIDGIYIDIPYWMTHFTGWEDSWASFDDYTVAAFKKSTGLDARQDIKLGDFSDPAFRKWIDFRIATITEFLVEIRSNAIAVNPNIAIIPEIFPGYEESAARVGADIDQIYPKVDAIAHEYEFGEGGDYIAAARTQFVWNMYQAGIRTFRAFAEDKSTWMLNYSWDGAPPHVDPREAMLNLAMSELMAGANVWDAKGHVMSGSNDMPTRTKIFQWIADHEDTLSAPRLPLGTIGVYFSETTRNYYPKEFVDSYQGALLLLLRKHIQFQIVTPRTLQSFHGTTLILPDVHLLDTAEESSMRRFYDAGGKLVLNGQSAKLLQNANLAVRFPDDPGSRYLIAAKSNLQHATANSESDFLKSLDDRFDISVKAPEDLIVHVAQVNQRPHFFFANFNGLQPGTVAAPVPVENVHILAPLALGTTLHLLPFMGTSTVIQGVPSEGKVDFTIPQIERGSIAWITH